jgi:putative transposase
MKEKLQLSDRIYKCEKCGCIIDRDYNAALNIKEAGSALLAW